MNFHLNGITYQLRMMSDKVSEGTFFDMTDSIFEI